MSDDDDLLRKLGALAKEQAAEPIDERPLDELARARIADHLATGLRPTKRRPVLPWVFAAAALAAGLLLFVRTRDDAEALPVYVLEASGAATARGPEPRPGPCVLHAGAGDFELVAKAEKPVGGAVHAHVFLQKGAELFPWSGPVAISEQGSVRLSASARTLDGASELRLVVGRDLDAAKALARAKAGTEGEGARVLRCAIDP